jgi:capsid assembly protease
MTALRAFDVAASRPWCILPESLSEILAVADRMGDPEALETRLGKPLENTRTVDIRSNGVAIVPVTGPIFRYANLFTRFSGGTATGVLATDIQTALDERSVRAILIDVNSPGGEAAGVNELADMIFAARARKPIWAYVGGMGASGGYWIPSAASRVFIDKTALLGSIGVVMSYRDTRARDEKAGVRDVEIVSSASPDKRLDPTTEVGRAKVLSIVDDMANVFVDAVARNRGVPREKVLNDFGRGHLLVGDKAVAAGMADGISSLESVIAELAGHASTSTRIFTMTTSSAGKGPVTVRNTAELHAAGKSGHIIDEITVDTDQARQAGHAAGLAEGKADSDKRVTDAVAAERKRIHDISAATQKGFEKESAAAIEKGTSAGDFALEQAKAAKDRGVTLAGIRSDSSPPAKHGGQPAANVDKTAAASGWDKAAKRLGAKS